MRKPAVLFLLLTLPLFIQAQHFTEAPKLDKPVRQIVEWTTFPADDRYPEETIKETVYNFRKDGQIESLITNDLDEEEQFSHYDNKGRLTEVIIKTKYGESKMTYRYQPGLKIAEIIREDLHLKNMQYLNAKNQVVEEKEYAKGEFTKNEMKLISRKILNYNNKDVLFGEMTYLYDDNKVKKRKIVYFYDPVSHKKVRTIVTDDNGKTEEETIYLYNQNDQLGIVESKLPKTGDWEKTEYRYKDDQLWQEIITTGTGYRYEKIFLDKRMVRYKESIDGVLEWYTDFQYVYY